MDRWLLRASQWARKPPSWKRVKLLLIVLTLCLVLFGVEHFVGWPAWMTVNGKAKLP